MPQIPVIDMTAYRSGEDPSRTWGEVGDAVATHGFLQIVGHGIAPEVIDAVYRDWNQFLSLDDQQKAALASPTGHPYRGWLRRFDDRGQAISERMQVSVLDGPQAAAQSGVPEQYTEHFSPNVWPTTPATLKGSMVALFTASTAVGMSLMTMFERYFDLPPGTFTQHFSPGSSNFAINHYPSRAQPCGASTVNLAEHVDSGTLTMLHQRGTYDGLQIRDTNGDWMTIPALDDALVINVGNLMSLWTGGRLRATPHRVIASDDRHAHRTSLTTFHTPNVDTVISPLLPPLPGTPDCATTTFEASRDYIRRDVQ